MPQNFPRGVLMWPSTVAYVCGMPATGSYLIPPGWDSSYPTSAGGNDLPLSMSYESGEFTLITEVMAGQEGDPGIVDQPLAITAVGTTWTHLGSLIAPFNILLTVGFPLSDRIWSPPDPPGPHFNLRRLEACVIPIQFCPSFLFFCTRRGYSNLADSTWYSMGWMSSFYAGDIQNYTPVAWSGVGANGSRLEINYAKWFNGQAYVICATTVNGPSLGPSNPGPAIFRFPLPNGQIPASIGETFGHEMLYPDNSVNHTYSHGTQDITLDYSTNKLYRMEVLFVSGSWQTTVMQIDPMTLAPIQSWVSTAMFEPPSGFSVRASRAVFASDASGTTARRFWVMDLNGSSGMDLVHLGLDEVDPTHTLPGAYVWADPICGWLKQKIRWISPVVGP